MNKIYWLAVVAIAVFSVMGCSGGDNDQAPSKAEIDKGLQGQPAIDPNQFPPMKPGKAGTGKPGP